MRDMIEVPRDKLDTLIKNAYRLSGPQGLGHMHFEPGELSDAEVKTIRDERANDPTYPVEVSMDYVKGRAVKLTVWRGRDVYAGKLFIENYWFDHSKHQLAELLAGIGIKPIMPLRSGFR